MEDLGISSYEILAFNFSFVVKGFFLFSIFSSLYPNSYTYFLNSIPVFIYTTIIYFSILYFLISKYISYDQTKQTEDIYFKALSKEDNEIELLKDKSSGILPDTGDLNFSEEFIEDNFCT